MCGVNECKKDNPLNGNGVSMYKAANFHLAAPCSESTAPFLVPLLNPHCPLFSPLPTQTCEHVQYNTVSVRYHSGGSMKLNACNLLLAHMVYL